MGTQTMGSGGGGETIEPKSHVITRQGSMYNLTLDEVELQLGDLRKPLTSMNLDELLKSVWTDQVDRSGIMMSLDLSKKTVDEVWQDIQQGRNGNNSNNRRSHERQLTLGEMTLEDFLVKAGIVVESSSQRNLIGQEQILLPPQGQWMPYQQNQHNNMMSIYMHGHPIQQPVSMGVETVYPKPQMSMSPSGLMGALSDTQTPSRKRSSGDLVEKTVERRQKRMIKNRESAARSRARKQAYTHELENKVSRLEEENEMLKRQKEVEKLLPSPPTEPKYQLRRTSSAGF